MDLITNVAPQPSGEETKLPPGLANPAPIVAAVGEERLLLTLPGGTGGGFLWISGDLAVVSVDLAKQKLVARKVGATVLTLVRQADRQVVATLPVTVVEKRLVADIQITPAQPTVYVGDTVGLTAVVTLADGTLNGNVAWSSADETVATVDPSTGLVRALREGRVSIFASYSPDPRYKGRSDISVVNAGVPADTRTSPLPVAPPGMPGVSPLPIPLPPSGSATTGPLPTAKPPASVSPTSSPVVVPKATSSPIAAPTPTVPRTLTATVVGTFSATRASRLAIDSNDNIWVLARRSDNSTLVMQLSQTGVILRNWDVDRYASAIGIDRVGNVWIGCHGVNGDNTTKIQRFSENGVLLGTHPVASIDVPSQIVFDADGNAWVVCSGRITYKFAADGTALDSTSFWGFVTLSFDAAGNGWAGVRTSLDILRLNPSGEQVGSFPLPKPGNLEAGALVTDSAGNAHLVCVPYSNGSGHIYKVSPNGTLLSTLPAGKPGRQLAIDGGDNLWGGELREHRSDIQL